MTKVADNLFADVAALKSGGYVVVWRSNNSPGLESDLYIEARLVNADGTPNGPEFKANASDGPNVSQPTVTELVDGGFVVVWAGTGVQVQGRRFMADATPVSGDFQINTLTEGTEAEPDAALHSDGRVMVVWETQEIPGEDREIRGRIFSSTLQAQGSDFRINTLTDGVQDNPKVGDYGRGGFFVAWDSAVSIGNDNDAGSIQGRIVTGSDQFAGPDIQINRWIAGGQANLGLSGRGDHIAIAWRSTSNEDTNDDVITAQLWFVCGIFCDSFE